MRVRHQALKDYVRRVSEALRRPDEAEVRCRRARTKLLGNLFWRRDVAVSVLERWLPQLDRVMERARAVAVLEQLGKGARIRSGMFRHERVVHIACLEDRGVWISAHPPRETQTYTVLQECRVGVDMVLRDRHGGVVEILKAVSPVKETGQQGRLVPELKRVDPARPKIKAGRQLGLPL